MNITITTTTTKKRTKYSLFRSFSRIARSMRRVQQTEDILDAMAKNDLDGLKKLARSPEGFVDDKLRQYVW